jgi:type IV secretory pathway protease TraF
MSNEGRSVRDQLAGTLQASHTRRSLGLAVAGIAVGAIAARLGWVVAKSRSGRSGNAEYGSTVDRQLPTAAPRKLQVTGPSMAPTLWGPTAELICGACGVVWPVHWQPTLRPRTAVTCWNCGASVAIDGAVLKPGDEVWLEPLAREDARLSAGDLVAIAAPEAHSPHETHLQHAPAGGVSGVPAQPILRVKRLVAGPGQRVTHLGGQLHVDDAAVVSSTVWIPVHHDAYRRDSYSWWKPQTQASGNGSIRITADGFHLKAIIQSPHDSAAAASDWLVYHHRDVHNQLQPDSVRDDVPWNVTEVRKLLPVARLRLSLRVATDVAGLLEVAFWDGTGAAMEKRRITAGGGDLEIEGPRVRHRALNDTTMPGIAAAAKAGLDLPELSQEKPIAMRITAPAAEVSQIRIDRPLEYTIDSRLAASIHWPIELGADGYFVLGDNVPLSIDSRQFGPITRSGIVGRIRRVSYDDRQR